MDAIETYGLTHIALAVQDLDRSARFYGTVFGCREVYRDAGFLQIQTPGSRDVLVFEERQDHVGDMGGVAHFGFRLVRSSDVDQAAELVKHAGGKVLRQGEFCPGEPYLFVADPDGPRRVEQTIRLLLRLSAAKSGTEAKPVEGEDDESGHLCPRVNGSAGTGSDD